MTSSEPRLQIRTQHCTFCNHLLLATTRDISSLPRRGGEAKDKAIILPLEDRTIGEDADINEAQGTRTKHATLLLSTTIPDRRATLIRREDGIEKRVLLRCGRCKAVMGYYLDSVHYGEEKTKVVEDDDGNVEEKRPAVYILPGAIIETDKMGGDSDDAEWRGWNNEA